MTSLSEWQQTMSAALLGGEWPPELLSRVTGARLTPVESLRIHRNNVLGALVSALRLSFPSVAQVLGSDLFDRLAMIHAQGRPPQAAELSDYGDGFAEFIAQSQFAAERPWLAELACFDRLLEQLTRSVAQAPTVDVALDGGLRLRLASSLRLFECSYAVDELRERLAGCDAPALPIAAPEHAQFFLAAWRSDRGVSTLRLNLRVAVFLRCLLQGQDAAEALELASADVELAQLLPLIDQQVFRARFARLELSTTVQGFDS